MPTEWGTLNHVIALARIQSVKTRTRKRLQQGGRFDEWRKISPLGLSEHETS